MKFSFQVFIATVCIVMLSGCTTSMYTSLARNDINAVKLAIESGEDVNSFSINGNVNKITPLGMAVTASSRTGSGMTKMLVNKGADVNLTNNNLGNTAPIHHAAAWGSAEVVELLIVNGADVNCLTDKGETPLEYAKSNFKDANAKVLSSRGGIVLTPEAKRKYVIQFEQRRAQAAYDQQIRDRAESREMWKAIATLGTGIAVGKATSGYSPDQQTRMMRSSMKAVDSGDTSEFTETTNQVKAEQAQSHKAKMQAIEAQKGRDARKNQQGNSSGVNFKSQANSSGKSGLTLVASNQRNSATVNDGAANQETFKPAFTYTSDPSNCHKEVDDLNRPYRGRSLSDPNYKEPPFYCAWEVSSSGSSSASEQSQGCSKAKQQILFSGKGHEVVKDFGCGCSFRNDVGAGLLSCGYYMILKRPEKTGSTRSSGGKSK